MYFLTLSQQQKQKANDNSNSNCRNNNKTNQFVYCLIETSREEEGFANCSAGDRHVLEQNLAEISATNENRRGCRRNRC